MSPRTPCSHGRASQELYDKLFCTRSLIGSNLWSIAQRLVCLSVLVLTTFWRHLWSNTKQTHLSYMIKRQNVIYGDVIYASVLNGSYQENIILIIRKNRSNACVILLILKRDVDQDGSIRPKDRALCHYMGCWMTEILKYWNSQRKTHQSIIEDKEADISAMMHFIPSHDRTGMIPYPHPCQLDVCNLAVFIRSLWNSYNQKCKGMFSFLFFFYQ